MHKLRANVNVSRGNCSNRAELTISRKLSKACLKPRREFSPETVHTSLESQLLNILAISPVRVETLE